MFCRKWASRFGASPSVNSKCSLLSSLPLPENRPVFQSLPWAASDKEAVFGVKSLGLVSYPSVLNRQKRPISLTRTC